MRTTVTLDPDAEAAVRDLMQRRGISFKQALNDAIRSGVATPRTVEEWTVVHDLGQPRLDLDRALQLAAELEDDESVHDLARHE